MGKKVEICGLNAAALPKLSAKEQNELLKKVAEGDETARQKFIFSNLRLVLSVVQRYGSKVANAEDLFQVGCVGLVKAVDHFDPKFNVRFSTYAVPMIVGEIRRLLRESNSMRVSRGIRDTAYKALQARQAIEANGNGMADVEQIAEYLHMQRSEVVYALDAISEPISLFEPVYSDGEDQLTVMDQIRDKKNTDEKWVENVSLAEAVKHLNERERAILAKRYFEGKTQMEISAEVGISQAQVSRLEKNAVTSLKNFYSE